MQFCENYDDFEIEYSKIDGIIFPDDDEQDFSILEIDDSMVTTDTEDPSEYEDFFFHNRNREIGLDIEDSKATPDMENPPEHEDSFFYDNDGKIGLDIREWI